MIIRMTSMKTAKTAQKRNILLIEDDPTDARIVTEALTNSPCHHIIENVYTLKEGLEKLDHQHFDLILLDLSLPDGAGISCVDRLIEKAARIPIVILTDVNNIQFASLAIQRGVQDFWIRGEIPTSALVRILDNAMIRKQSQSAMQETIDNLKERNQKILDQQKSVIEEERLKMMLQMAGATAHELNQPLMSLLGYIELIEVSNDKPEKYFSGIKKSGERISAIVKKIQSIRLDCVIPHTGGPGIIKIDQTITLLSIEDSDHDFGRLEEILKHQSQVNLLRVKSIQKAVELLKTHPVELVFLDHILPDGTSFDFLKILNDEKKQLPVVVVTGQGDEKLAPQIIQSGAYDYITKGNLNLSSVTRIVKNTLEKFQLKQEMQKAVDKLAKLATQDEVTSLSNCGQLNETLEWKMSCLLRNENDLACLMIDLDHFKQINDNFSHDFGDQVLKEFVLTLQNLVQSDDMIFRYGGDEFVVLLPKTDLYGGVQVAEKIRTYFENKRYQYEGQSIVITVSIGVAAGVHHGLKDGKALLSLAEKALYTAKAKGCNQVQVHPSPLDGGADSIAPGENSESCHRFH
jgi:two-component system, cell cycle response regulator